MANIHMPTIPSGPTSSRSAAVGVGPRSIAELERQKNDMEAELRALSGVLDSHGVDMQTPLVTGDGFPRSDIDVAQIRTTRSRIIHLRNDYKDIMARIETCIHEHFAGLKNNSATNVDAGEGQETAPLRDYVPEELMPPFAKVNTVVNGGPADHAGLRPGDQIRNFGYVNVRNHDGLKKVAECVQGNENQNILVKVSRPLDSGGQEELRLSLTPLSGWGGRGLLGCHILPIG
ncbi:26S proteasome non-ATPase regulatory subunit 9 [Ceratocystis lukuohia]|uniref:26S proteasome non-ATPase regulatory subunit 9 n=1 Tax=Ceratocystis lukuohia TaxID=2019550 RepID=A0ABR4MP95_9PEZI